MQVYRIAGMNIDFTPRFEYSKNYMRDYLTEADSCELSIDVTDEMMEYERRLNREIHGDEASDGLCEVIAALRVICDYIIGRGGFFLHCSCLRDGDDAIVFTAPSGTGKSTHASLWRKHFGDQVTMINDDKPLVREQDGRFVIYGTPWNGKHHIGNNISAPIKAIFILQQAPQNSVEPIDSFTALSALLQQTVLPSGRGDLSRLLDMLGRMIEKTPILCLKCNISDEAVMTAYRAVYGDRPE